jgi:hypothetical protein
MKESKWLMNVLSPKELEKARYLLSLGLSGNRPHLKKATAKRVPNCRKK